MVNRTHPFYDQVTGVRERFMFTNSLCYFDKNQPLEQKILLFWRPMNALVTKSITIGDVIPQFQGSGGSYSNGSHDWFTKRLAQK